MEREQGVKRLAASIVIPTYNRAALIGRAVRSVLAGCSERDEIIVVDDGSTDDTEKALAPYRDRILYIRTPNGGVGKARNLGIQRAKNPLVAFLDSDDEWMADKLSLQRTLMEARPDILFCFSDFIGRSASGEEERRYLINWHKDPRRWEEILGPGALFSSIAPLPSGRKDFHVYVGDLYLSEMAANYVFTSTMTARREAAGEALRFAEDFSVHEDWECFGRLAGKGLAAYLDCETAWQHGHEGPRLSDADSMRRAAARISVLERVWGGNKAFLQQHGRRYEKIMAEQRLIKSRELIRLGRTREAREELRFVEETPLSHRLLASLPGPITQGMMEMRRVLQLMLRGIARAR